MWERETWESGVESARERGADQREGWANGYKDNRVMGKGMSQMPICKCEKCYVNWKNITSWIR